MHRNACCVGLFVLLMVPTAGWSDERLAKAADPPAWRVEIDQLDALPWKRAVERLTSVEPLKSGRGEYTLLRVVLEGQEPEADKLADELRVVNGVPVRITGRQSGGDAIESGTASQHPANPFAAPITVDGTKVLSLSSYPSGGGSFCRLNSGDFVVVEHINSASRRGGKDPLRVHTTTHGLADLWIPVPRQGELGVFGEVVLPRIEPALMGRLIAEVEVSGYARSRAETLTVRLATGGYGEPFPINEHGMATTRLLAPGGYLVQVSTGERTRKPIQRAPVVRVLPGRVTYLTFRDTGEDAIELAGSTTFDPSASGPSMPE